MKAVAAAAAFKRVASTAFTTTAALARTQRSFTASAAVASSSHRRPSHPNPNSSKSSNFTVDKQPLYDYAVHRNVSIDPLPLFDFFAVPKAKPSYSLSHGAAGFAKRRKALPSTVDTDLYNSNQVGEDAYFCRSDALGVADGVGGWVNTAGANAAMYSRQLMHYAYQELERFDNVEDPCFYHYDQANPLAILQNSYDHMQRHNNVVGSATACLALLRNDELRIANLGDCGISVIRRNHYVFRSEEQQHAFNFPYQLGTGSMDRPTDAQTFDLSVEKGDVIIVGSDGLFDNLYDREILALVQQYLAQYTLQLGNQMRMLNFQPQKLAHALALRAKSVSEDRRHIDSPFQTRAMHEGIYYQGGKPDDISVLVAVVGDSEDSPDRRL